MEKSSNNKIHPFATSEWAARLQGLSPRDAFSLPPPVEIIVTDVKRFARLWMLEGIPVAFMGRPIFYEYFREHVSKVIAGWGIASDPKDVSIVGSARLGFSLNPKNRLSEFQPGKSDFDVLVINASLFKALDAEFLGWLALWEAGEVTPKPMQEPFWKENRRVVEQTRQKGFIDPNKIPNLPNSIFAKRLWRLAETLRGRVCATPELPDCTASTLRIYESVDSAVEQIALTVVRYLRQLKMQQGPEAAA